MNWLISESEFNLLSFGANGEFDMYDTVLDNGLICKTTARDLMFIHRFEFKINCPSCSVEHKIYSVGDDLWKCSVCLDKFTITSKTFIDNTKLECYHWVRFAYLVGVLKIKNSTTIANDLQVTQSTAYDMLKRLRESIQYKEKKGVVSIECKNMYEVLENILTIKK